MCQEIVIVSCWRLNDSIHHLGTTRKRRTKVPDECCQPSAASTGIIFLFINRKWLSVIEDFVFILINSFIFFINKKKRSGGSLSFSYWWAYRLVGKAEAFILKMADMKSVLINYEKEREIEGSCGEIVRWWLIIRSLQPSSDLTNGRT